jgi:acetyl-CoA C-acetyltransferase
MEKVGIVAAAQTKFEECKVGTDISEMIYEVVKQVLEETGLKFTEDGTGIDSTVSCSQDLWDGRTISSAWCIDVAGGHLRPEEKVAGDGVSAVAYATMQILSGHYDIVLVVAYCRESITHGRMVEWMSVDPIFHRMLGLDFCSAAALQARRYMGKYGITSEQCAKEVVKSHRNAKNNPYAQAPKDLTVEDVLNSPILASPIRALDAKPTSDGACALILAGEEKARKLTNKPVWIRGIGSCYDVHYLGDRDLADCGSLILAAKQAYNMAGIVNPLKEINVAEISEEYSYQGLLWVEGLGFCERGRGGKLIDERVTEMDGKLPINPSGGVLVGNPTSVAGAVRIAEASLQLKEQAGARQVPNVKTALAHGMDGVCGQLHHVMILGV